MTAIIRGFRHRHYHTAVSTTDILDCKKVPEGERWYIESVTIFNDTTDNCNCLVGVLSGGSFTPVKYFVDVTYHVWETKFLSIWLFPGEQLEYQFTDIVVDDAIQVSGIGHRRIEN